MLSASTGAHAERNIFERELDMQHLEREPDMENGSARWRSWKTNRMCSLAACTIKVKHLLEQCVSAVVNICLDNASVPVPLHSEDVLNSFVPVRAHSEYRMTRASVTS